MKNRRDARVLVVGVGGLGCPCALALARAGVGTLRLCDDDVVDVTNLHRQILFDDASVGKSKLDEAERALHAMADMAIIEPRTPERSGGTRFGLAIERTATRFLPQRAREIIDGCDLVVEGADNFATKFLVADACALAGVPVVHAAAVRLHGTALAVAARGAPCYRCVFEDLPRQGEGESAANCETAGVLGPMVGVVGALQADLALALLDGRDVGGTFAYYDAASDTLRKTRFRAREGCALCGRARRIDDLEEGRYKG